MEGVAAPLGVDGRGRHLEEGGGTTRRWKGGDTLGSPGRVIVEERKGKFEERRDRDSGF